MIRNPLAKILRRISKLNYELRSHFRRLIIQLRYPSCKIGRGVKIGRNVQFLVTDGASVHIGDGTCIKDNCVIIAKYGILTIGTNSFIGWGTIICSNEEVRIGKDCLIGEFVTIRDQNHGAKLIDSPFREQPMHTGPIEISDNVWIGAKSTVLAGSSIATDSIVAAHGVVNSTFESGVIIGGIPAAVIKPLS